jgi:uncharacterized protein (DUF1501 family)
MQLDRRSLLKLSASAATLAAFGPRSASAQVNRDVIVSIFLRGGIDGLTALPPLGDARYAALRPNLALRAPGSASGLAALELNGFFGLHPSAAPLKTLYAAGKLAVVCATGVTSPSRSHFDMQDFMERAYLDKSQVFSGWLNRHLEHAPSGNESAFRALGIGNAVQRTISGAVPAIGLSTIARFGVQTSAAEHDVIDRALIDLYNAAGLVDQRTRSAYSAIDQLAAIGAAASVENGAQYPTTTFGTGMRELAQLLKADLGIEAVSIDLGGWDHHDTQLNRIAPLLDELSKALFAFDLDLGARMANVSVVVMSEFGRRVAENASAGTDHGHGNVMFALGGGVNGGRVFGNWPGLNDSALNQGDLAITTDYRAVLADLLRARVANTNLAATLPGFSAGPALGVFRAR